MDTSGTIVYSFCCVVAIDSLGHHAVTCRHEEASLSFNQPVLPKV